MSHQSNIPTPEAMGLPRSDVVYVRSVAASDLEDGIETPPGIETFYALHDATGRRLALFEDRDFAFAVARQNDLTAMSVH